MDEAPIAAIGDRELLGLVDSLDQMIVHARSWWFGRVSLNRKKTKDVVDAIGARLDLQQGAAGATHQQHEMSREEFGEVLVKEALTELQFLVKSGGDGGAAYRLRYLDVKRQRLTDTIQMLRNGLELRAGKPSPDD